MSCEVVGHALVVTGVCDWLPDGLRFVRNSTSESTAPYLSQIPAPLSDVLPPWVVSTHACMVALICCNCLFIALSPRKSSSASKSGGRVSGTALSFSSVGILFLSRISHCKLGGGSEVTGGSLQGKVVSLWLLGGGSEVTGGSSLGSLMQWLVTGISPESHGIFEARISCGPEDR